MFRRFITCAGLAVLMLAAGLFVSAGARAQQGGSLVLYSWPNYVPPNLLRRFEAETGIAVQLEIFESNEQMLARITDPDHGYDLVIPSDYAAARMIRDGLAMSMDAYNLPNFANVLAPHDAPSYDPARRYTAPYLWGSVGFAYDSDAVDGALLPESWSVLFDPPEALKGRIAMLDDEVEVYNAAAHYLGIDPCTADTGRQARVLDLLRGQAANVTAYSSSATVSRMLTGAASAHMQWNTSAHRVRSAKPGVVYVYPREGLSWWQDNFVMPTGAVNTEQARTFVNWMMQPKTAAEASNFAGYMNTIRGSSQFLEPALRGDTAINMPSAYGARLKTVEICPPDVEAQRHTLWQAFRSELAR